MRSDKLARSVALTRFHFFFLMVRIVGSLREKHEVFKAIIRAIAVYVMDMFMMLQSAAKMCSHEKSMFKDSALDIGHRVPWKIDLKISVARFAYCAIADLLSVSPPYWLSSIAFTKSISSKAARDRTIFRNLVTGKKLLMAFYACFEFVSLPGLATNSISLQLSDSSTPRPISTTNKSIFDSCFYSHFHFLQLRSENNLSYETSQ